MGARIVCLIMFMLINVGACSGVQAASFPDLHIRNNNYTMDQLLTSGVLERVDWSTVIPWAVQQPRLDWVSVQLQSNTLRHTGFEHWPLQLFVSSQFALEISGSTLDFFDSVLRGSFATRTEDISYWTRSVERQGVSGLTPLLSGTSFSVTLPWSVWNVHSYSERSLAGAGFVTREGHWMAVDSHHKSSTVTTFRERQFSGSGASVGFRGSISQGSWLFSLTLDPLWYREGLHQLWNSTVAYNTEPIWEERNGRLVRPPAGQGHWEYLSVYHSLPRHASAAVTYSGRNWSTTVGHNNDGPHLRYQYNSKWGVWQLDHFPWYQGWQLGWDNGTIQTKILTDHWNPMAAKAIGVSFRIAWFF